MYQPLLPYLAARSRFAERSFRRLAALAVASLFAAAGLFATAGSAHAAAYSFNSGASFHTINVGFLMLDSAKQTGPTGIDHPAWYAFYILNQRPDVKPAGWNVDNPLAPKVVTSDIDGRYGNVYQIGQAITPNMAPYWEVDITRTNIQSLEQFNVLAIHTNDVIDLTQQERLLLRQYIDQGGTLIVDNCGGATTGPLFLFNAQFGNGVAGQAIVPNPTQRHPIITTPYFLSQDDLNNLGDKKVGTYYIGTGRGTGVTAALPDPSIFTTVVGNTGESDLPYICAGDYGSGHVVMSAGDIFDDISDPVDPEQANHQPIAYSNTDFSAAGTQDLKLLVNIISWATSTAETDGVNDRHSGSQISTIDGAMSREWLYPDPGVSPGANFTGSTSSPAIFGNIAFVSDGLGNLHAYDIDPPESLAGTINPDDGGAGTDPITNLPYLNDFDNGTSYDELWTVNPKNGVLSAPTVATIPNEGTCVLVEGDDGTVYAYPAGTATPTAIGQFKDGNDNAPTFSSLGTQPPYGLPFLPPAPTVYDGRILAGQANGNVEVTDFAPAVQTFTFTSSLSNNTTPVIAPPTIASIPSNDPIYGGGDIIAYITDENAVDALQIGSRDESIQLVPGQTYYQTKPAAEQGAFANSQGDLDLINPPEDPLNGSFPQPGVYYNAPNFAETGFVAPNYTAPGYANINAATTPDGYGPPFFGDYDLELTANAGQGTTISVTRSEINAKTASQANQTSNENLLAGGAAVGPDNTVYITVNEPSLNTCYIEAIAEQDPFLGGPREVIKWRFALTSGVTDASGIQYSFSNYQFVGPPVVDGTTVYALAQQGNNGAPIVMAFFTNAVCGVHAASQDSNTSKPTVSQIDESGQNSASQVQPYQYSFSYLTGLIQFTNFNGGSGSAASPNVIANLVAPLPVSVTQSAGVSGQQSLGAQTMPMDTGLGGIPLLDWWTAPLSGGSNYTLGALRKIGNFLYFPVTFTNGATNTSEMAVVDTALGVGPNNATNDRQIVIGNLTPAQQQVFFQHFLVGAATPTNPPVYASALAASGNFAVVQFTGSGFNGIEGFGFHPTLVADGSRLIELGPSGDAIWAVDSTNQEQIQGGNLVDPDQATAPTQDQTGQIVSSKVSLNHPASISQIGQDDYLVADSGNNRVVRVDAAGHVIWELTNFSDPYNLITPAGANPALQTSPQPNSILSLNQPSDAAMWQTSSAPGVSPQIVTYHYLIADTGNYRIIEVDDTYSNGQIENITVGGQTVPLYHYIAWTSHTQDEASRQYRYISAQLVPGFNNGTQTYYVLGGVANANIAPLVNVGGNAQLAPANQDGPGTSLLLLNYQPGQGVATDGLPVGVIGQITNNNSGAGYVSQPIRGLHSVQAYLPPNAGSATSSAMLVTIADDDGVFSGPIEITPATAATTTTPLVGLPQIGPMAIDYTYNSGPSTGFSLTLNSTNGAANAGYGGTGVNSVVNQYDAALQLQFGKSDPVYAGTLFAPASAVRLPSGDYLIVNRGASGNIQNLNLGSVVGADRDFGGNVFEVAPNGNLVDDEILGRPGNTSSLAQPAFAIRPL